MRLETRSRKNEDGSFTTDLLIICDPEESKMIDHIFGDTVDDYGLIANFQGEVRLSGDLLHHYLICKGNKR